MAGGNACVEYRGQRNNGNGVPKPGGAEVVAYPAGSASSVKISTGEIPCAVGIDSLTNAIYVVNYASNSVTLIDGAAGEGCSDCAGGRSSRGDCGRFGEQPDLCGEYA